MTAQHTQPAAQAANDTPWIDTPWIDPPAQRQPMAMVVRVKTSTNRQYEYQGLFRHTFDAYDHALDRYPLAQRIEVKPIDHASTTTGDAHGPHTQPR